MGDYIWNHYEKSIQTSTNMPDINLEICESLRIRETKRFFYIQWPHAKY